MAVNVLRNILPKSGTFLPGHPVYTYTTSISIIEHYIHIYSHVSVND